MGDELGDQRVEIDRDLRAFDDAGIDPHRRLAGLALGRRPVAVEAPDRRQEFAIGILGIEPRLDRPAVERDVVLRDRELLAGRDPDHLLDQVDTGDQLGHRMLDLQPRVHLEEIEASGPGP